VYANVAVGWLKSMRTVLAPSASIALTVFISGMAVDEGSDLARSRLALTTDASSLLPSWNVTSSRSVNVSCFWSSLIFHSVASIGFSWKSRSNEMRRS